jgi:hypothetical protein
MSKESESYRLQMLRRFERENSGAPPPEVLEAQKVVADFGKKQASAKEVADRLRAPLPKPDLCPQCYYLHARTNPMHSIPHPDHNRFDLWRCDVCRYEEEREIIR